MRHHAETLRRAGRFGDDQLVHLNRRELGHLSQTFGEPTTNPTTGLPEFFDLGGLLSWLAPAIVPAATEAIGGAGTLGDLGGLFGAGSAWAPTLGAAGLGALTGGLTQGLQGKSALTGALGGGLIGGAVPSMGKALGFNEFSTPFNIPTLFDVGSMVNGGPSSSMVSGVTANETASPFAAGPAAAGAAPAAAAGSSGWLSKLGPLLAMGALAAAGSGTSKNTPPPPQTLQQQNGYVLPTGRLNRSRNTKQQTVPGEYNFFDDNQTPAYAHGGEASGPPGPGAQGYIQGPGDGREDAIPARLSNDEYVLDAETMALLGNGSPSAGADKMDQFRTNLRRHKGAALAKGKFSPKAKSVEGYLS